MGFCPNCGSWVDEGDICMTCGGHGQGQSDESYMGGQSGNIKRRFTKDDIACCKASLRSVANPKMRYIPDEAALKILELAENSSPNMMSELYDTVIDAENQMDARMVEITYEKNNALFCMIHKSEYADVTYKFIYYGGRGFHDWYQDISDEKLKRIPEYMEMVREVEDEGFRYEGISRINNSRRREDEPYAFVEVDFRKGNVLKRYEFHFADFTYFESYSYTLQG